MFNDLLSPSRHLSLAQAVLRTARVGSPFLWSADSIPEEEAQIYADLGSQWEPFELWAAFCPRHERDELRLWLPVEDNRVNAIRAAASDARSQERYESYRAAEKVLRRALYTGSVPFVLQHSQSAELFDAKPVLWGQTRAPKWFSTGCVPVLDGGIEREYVGSGWFSHPSKRPYFDIPTGSQFHVLIPEEGLTKFLEEACGERSLSPKTATSPLADQEVRRRLVSFEPNARWSIDQLLIWLAERDATPAFAAARHVRDPDKRSLTWVEYRLSHKSRSDLADIEARAINCLSAGRLVAACVSDANASIAPGWFEGKKLVFDSTFGAVFKSDPIHLPSEHYELSVDAHQVLALYPPSDIKEGVEPELIDHGIYPLSVAWRKLAYRLSRESCLPIEEAEEKALNDIKAVCAQGQLRLLGYAAQDGRPNEEQVEAVPPDRVRSLYLDPLAGQPQHEFRDGRPWREYGAAMLTNEYGPLRWTGLHFERDEFSRMLFDGSTPPLLPAPGATTQDGPLPISKSERDKRGRKTIGISLAVQDLWSGRVPDGLTVKERDIEIMKWLRQRGHSVPNPRSIRRFFNQ